MIRSDDRGLSRTDKICMLGMKFGRDEFSSDYPFTISLVYDFFKNPSNVSSKCNLGIAQS